VFKKGYEALGLLNQWLYDEYPQYRRRLSWAWKRGAINTSGMLHSAAANFVQRHGLFCQSEAIEFGLTSEGGSAYWCITVGVPRGESASSIVEAAAALPAAWERSVSRERPLRLIARVSEFREAARAVEWFQRGVEEVAHANLLPRLFPVTADDEVGDVEADQEDVANLSSDEAIPSA
jgi:hypothetical protein